MGPGFSFQTTGSAGYASAAELLQVMAAASAHSVRRTANLACWVDGGPTAAGSSRARLWGARQTSLAPLCKIPVSGPEITYDHRTLLTCSALEIYFPLLSGTHLVICLLELFTGQKAHDVIYQICLREFPGSQSVISKCATKVQDSF